MFEGNNFVVTCVILYLIVWAVTKAYMAIDGVIATKLMGLFQRPVGSPSQGQEQKPKTATKNLDELVKEALAEAHRDWEQGIVTFEVREQGSANCTSVR